MTSTSTETRPKLPEFFEKAQQFSRFVWVDKWLPLDKLKVIPLGYDDGFQRPLQERRVKDLVAHFDAGEARPIFVSFRGANPDDPNGEYVVLDGQHTAEACRRMNLTHWACRIFYGMSLADEAAHFVEYQANSRRIPSVVQHNAEVIAADRDAVAIDNILRPFYLRISTAKLRNEEGYIPFASRGLFEKLLDISPSVLRETLHLCIDSWGHAKGSFSPKVMGALGFLLAASYTSSGVAPFDRGRLVAVLRNTTNKQLEERMVLAPGQKLPTGGAQRYGAQVILEAYLEGAPGAAKMRRDGKNSPQLPEKYVPKKDFEEHDFYTAESKDLGRTVVVPYVAPEVPPPAPRGRKLRTGVNETSEAPEGSASATSLDEASPVFSTVDDGENEDDFSFDPNGVEIA